MPGKKESTSRDKSPFSPSKQISLNIEMSKSEQTKSPKPASALMSAWLSKSASKKDSVKPVESKKDENLEPKLKNKKTISARLSEAFSDTEEHIEKAVESKKAAPRKKTSKVSISCLKL